MRLALGLGEFLREFARAHDAVMYTNLKFDDWRDHLILVASDGETEILWNLTGINLAAGLQRAAAAAEFRVALAGATDWELLQFCQQHEWRKRTKFFDGEVEISDPFAEIGVCDHGDS